MNLQEILNDVDTFVPNTISTDQKVRWINQIQRQLFREFPVPDAVFQFETVPNLDYYDLPSDCAPDRITNLVIDGQQYEEQSLDAEEVSFYWVAIAGKIFIYPTPTEAKSAFIYYKPRPIDLTSSNLGATPNFPVDYHELLVYGCAARVAKAQRDVDLANNLQAEYNEIVNMARKDLRKTKSKRVRIVNDWR